MPARLPSPRLLLAPVMALLLAVAALPPASAAEDVLPPRVTVHDSRTSSPSVDIARVTLRGAPWENPTQYVEVEVPGGFRPGHHLTVWFDVDGDAEPEGRLDARLRKPGPKRRSDLRVDQQFRIGGGWDDPGTRVHCRDDQDFMPVGNVRPGDAVLVVGLSSLWDCLQLPYPSGDDHGAWRTAVRVAKDGRSDTAPSRRGWSPQVLGWCGRQPRCG
ncbi:hypothetical protein [Nocardioides sp. zg-1228]|uniref:hypothetical protein n=1 Tax=Nocardioides sp. zg-1228 TaxID=2763008 RepID=UPI00164276B2|nr:hypothetical protein [Nocardioides sp. zg-1228]MBC2931842.1 hypothetical protein [Nocardioides sp. zg-1228]QSF57411.1 hypothetical protein JX575_18020 [Nocardioides sp. zg-1228]